MRLKFTLNDDKKSYSVTSFEIEAGEDNSTVIIPSTFRRRPVVKIGDNLFRNYVSLTSVTIPSSVTSIGNYAFQNCGGLTSVTIPDGVTSIGNGTFSSCINLTSITIPDSVTSIGEWAFYHCKNLTSVTIPTSVTSISWGAFSYCYSFTNIIIPDSVTLIDGWAFYDCVNLKSVTLGKGVTSIGDLAFERCISLTDIMIPDCVTSIGDDAFYGCASLNRSGKFKATNADLICRDYKFTINEFSDKKEAVLCLIGYHYCENAFDLLNYYHGEIGKDVRFFEVETEGESNEKHSDSKRVCERIKLVREFKSYAELLNGKGEER